MMNRIGSAVIGAVMVATLVAGAAFAADVNMQEGNWETTVEMKIEGLPFPMPPMTYKNTECLTKKDMVPNTAGKDQTCEVKDQKITSNKVTWKVYCKDKQGVTEGDGEITYAGASYRGSMRMKTKDKGGETMVSNIKLMGKRLGACAK